MRLLKLYFQLALSVYLRANVPNKCVAAFAETGQHQKIIVYAKRVRHMPLLMPLHNCLVRTGRLPTRLCRLAAAHHAHQPGPRRRIRPVAHQRRERTAYRHRAGRRCLHGPEHDPAGDVFLARRPQGEQARASSLAGAFSFSLVSTTAAYFAQTRLLEMNLMNAPQVADAILGNEMFTHYDRPRIANLCEKAGLLQRVRQN